MTTTLSEGVKVPDVGSVNWAGDLEVNWNLLNGALANLSGNVKLDRDNTWTGEQSFTLPIVGSITGTASKAIADEDGTSIKTGYGKLANVNIWSTAQVFLNVLRFNNTSYVSGTPSENIFYTTLQWGGYVNNTWTAPFTINNAVRTNGYNDTSFRTYSQTSNTLTGFVHETNADASDISFRPIVNGTHKLGSSSYQWSSVYAQSYYYNGTEFTDKFVTTDTEQMITANKGIATYNATLALHNTQIEIGTAPAYQRNSEIFFGDKNYTELGRIMYRAATDGTRMMWLAINDKYANGALSPTGTNKWNNFFIRTDPTGYRVVAFETDAVIPNTNNINLGTSTNKWKTLNGINPGALSLPDYDRCVDKTSEIPATSLDGNTEIDINDYFPNLTGWINIVISDTSGNFIRAVQGKAGTAIGFNNSRSFHAGSTGGGFITLFMPIVAGTWKSMKIQASSVTQFRFYPCLGNV